MAENFSFPGPHKPHGGVHSHTRAHAHVHGAHKLHQSHGMKKCSGNVPHGMHSKLKRTGSY